MFAETEEDYYRMIKNKVWERYVVRKSLEWCMDGCDSRWYGCVGWMAHDRLVKMYFSLNEGTRRRGRMPKRWKDAVCDCLSLEVFISSEDAGGIIFWLCALESLYVWRCVWKHSSPLNQCAKWEIKGSYLCGSLCSFSIQYTEYQLRVCMNKLRGCLHLIHYI